MMRGLGCPRCGEMELCDGMTSCYVCEYRYQSPPRVEAAATVVVLAVEIDDENSERCIKRGED